VTMSVENVDVVVGTNAVLHNAVAVTMLVTFMDEVVFFFFFVEIKEVR
jgi:hypothetical protein